MNGDGESNQDRDQDHDLDQDPERDFSVFVSLQAAALLGSGVPERLWRSLHHKIRHEVRAQLLC